MAYEPTEWTCGDVITAEKLNKIENGIANTDSGGAKLPKVTATVNIDHPEYASYIGGTSMVDVEDGIMTPLQVNSPQATQVIEGYATPKVEGNVYFFYQPFVDVNTTNFSGHFETAYRDFVNMDESNTIIDPTQDASFTCDATWTTFG